MSPGRQEGLPVEPLAMAGAHQQQQQQQQAAAGTGSGGSNRPTASAAASSPPTGVQLAVFKKRPAERGKARRQAGLQPLPPGPHPPTCRPKIASLAPPRPPAALLIPLYRNAS